MKKQVEIVNASDPDILKPQLEQMVNVGWKIKGVINRDPNDANSQPFVILERDPVDDPSVKEELYINEEPLTEQYYSRPEPPPKEVCISVG